MELKNNLPYIQSSRIKELANQVGFDACGLCKPFISDTEKEHFSNWLKNRFNGNMNYLSQTEKRFNPGLVFPEVQSVIMLMLSYGTSATQNENAFYKVSKYAYGKDYHDLIKLKLKELEQLLIQENEEIKTFSFVDSSAVWEKLWAKKAGIGSIGKHSIIINNDFGSFFFISGIFINAVSEYDTEAEDICGTCELCITNCPTKAIVAPRSVDAGRCIAYHTIENKTEIPADLALAFGNNIYGCDICQDVCPYNKNENYKNHFIPNQQILELTKEQWENLDEKRFSELFSISAIKRIGVERMKRNIRFIQNSPE